MEGRTFSFETLDRIKYANFQLSYFSSDSSFIRWENGKRLRLHPDFNLHLFGHCIIFSGKRVTAPPKSEGARTPMVGTAAFPFGFQGL